MGIQKITRILKYPADFRLRFLPVRVSGGKVLHCVPHFRPDGVPPRFRKLFHQPSGFLCVPAATQIEEPLQIAGNQDVHGGRRGQEKLPVPVIRPALEKVIQDLVVIGSADQAAEGDSHLLGEIGRQNVAKIPRGNRHIDCLALFDLSILEKLRISVNIIYDLRHQPADVDGIRGGKLISHGVQLLGKRLVMEQLLYAGLGVVKVALQADDKRILPLLGQHLQLLDPADAVFRIKHEDPGSGNVREALHSRLSRIPRSSRQDHDLILDPLLFRRRRHQMRKDRKGHILKGNGLSMEQLQEINAVYLRQRRDLLRVKFPIIRLRDTVLKLLLRIIRKERLHYLIGRFLVAHFGKLLHGNRKLRDPLRHIKAAVLRQSFQYGLGRRDPPLAAAGAFI